jgi:hypothetical protein
MPMSWIVPRFECIFLFAFSRHLYPAVRVSSISQGWAGGALLNPRIAAQFEVGGDDGVDICLRNFTIDVCWFFEPIRAFARVPIHFHWEFAMEPN